MTETGEPADEVVYADGLDELFTRFIDYLRDQGCEFHALNGTLPDLSGRRVYLRYDVGAVDVDIDAALRLAALHERHRLPGTFCLVWDAIERDGRLREEALRLSQFDCDYINVGLKCDPISGWLLRARCDGDHRRFNELVGSSAFGAFVDELLAAWQGEGGEAAPLLRAVREGIWSYLAETDRSLREAFGASWVVSGSSSPLSNAFRKASQARPELSVLRPWFDSAAFLQQADLAILGYNGAAAELPRDTRPGPAVLFGGVAPPALREALHKRVAGRSGFVAIFPARYWSSGVYADLVEAVPQIPPADTAAAADAQDGSASTAGSVSLPEPAPLISFPEPGKIPDQPVHTWATDLEVFGARCEKVDKWQLAAAARGKVGSGVHISFLRFVQSLRSENYCFGGFEDGPPHFDERVAYLRYDVHGPDLLAAYVLAELHEVMRIIGSFQINWKYSGYEENLEPYFTKLLEFDQEFVRFGLHAAPTATWYINEKLGGDHEKQLATIASDEFVAWLLELHAAYARDGDEAPELRRIREGTDDTLASIAASFRETFGPWRSISGHGNFLTNGFVRARQAHPEIAVLERYFNPVAYLSGFGVERFGFDYEVTAVGADSVPFPRVLFEGIAEGERRRVLRGRMASGAGFVALLHPATWTCRQNAAFFLSEDAASEEPPPSLPAFPSDALVAIFCAAGLDQPSIRTQASAAMGRQLAPEQAIFFTNRGVSLDVGNPGSEELHPLAGVDSRFTRAFIANSYYGLFAIGLVFSWLHHLLADMGSGGELWIEIPSDETSRDWGHITYDALRERFAPWPVYRSGSWVVVARGEAGTGPALSTGTIYFYLHKAFPDFAASYIPTFYGERSAENERSARGTFIYSLNGLAYRQSWLDRVCRSHGLTECKRVLDIGGAIGCFAVECALHGDAVTILDSNERYLSSARWLAERCGVRDQIEFIHSPMEDLEEIDGQFDVITLFNCLLYARRSAASTIIRRAFELLSPNGVILLLENPKEAGDVKPGYYDYEVAFPLSEFFALMQPYEGHVEYWGSGWRVSPPQEPQQLAVSISKSLPKQLALYAADAPIEQVFAKAPAALRQLYGPSTTVAFSINTRHLGLAASSAGGPHMLSRIDDRFGNAVVLADLTLLNYPDDFALSWLASLLIGMGPGSEVWLELASEPAGDRPRVSFTLLRDRLEAAEPEQRDKWVVLRHTPALAGCVARLRTIHRSLYSAFDDLRAELAEGPPATDELKVSFLYSLYGAMHKSFIIERVLRHARLDGPRTILDVGSGPGYTACELAMHDHRLTLLELRPHNLQTAAWISKRCGVANRVIGLHQDMRQLADIGADDARFDCVIFLGSLLYIPRAEVAAVLEKAFGLLNPEGVLILWESPKELIAPGVNGYEQSFSSEEMLELLRPYESRCTYWNTSSGTASARPSDERGPVVVSIAGSAARPDLRDEYIAVFATDWMQPEQALARLPPIAGPDVRPDRVLLFSNTATRLEPDFAGREKTHLFSPIDDRFGHAVVLADFALLNYPGDFALSWLASLLLGMGPGSELWLEAPDEGADDNRSATFALLWERLGPAEPERRGKWVVLRYSPTLADCMASMPTIHRCLYSGFDDFRGALTAELQWDDQKLIVAFYSLYRAMEESFLIERVLRQVKLDGALSILDVGSGLGCTACELALHGHRVTMLDLSRRYLKVAAWLTERCGVADNVALLDRDMRQLAEIDGDETKFDCIMFFGSLLYAPRADVAAILETAFGLLRPEGVLILREYPKELIEPGVPTYEQAFTTAELLALLRPYASHCTYWDLLNGTASAMAPREPDKIVVSIARPAAPSHQLGV